MGWVALSIYGLGDILGAGIYGLVGKAAKEMGNAAWMAFVASMIAAAFTGLSYASLGSRYPKAAGASYISFRAFGSPFLSYLIGLVVLASGLTSMATASRVFSGYWQGLMPSIPLNLAILIFALVVTAIVYRGIKESLWANIVCTIIEVSGLVLIIIVAAPYLGSVNYFDASTSDAPLQNITPHLILSGAVLTFYSFVGFEDILNVSEEVIDAPKNLPRGLLMAVAASTVIYILIMLSAVSVVPASTLGTSTQPLVEVIKVAAPWFPVSIYGLIAMFAVSNTALLNFVMGSRMLYGMSHNGLLPKTLKHVHPKTQSPTTAVLIVGGLMLGLAMIGNISSLAKATSVLLLSCFCIINVALIVLKHRKGEAKGKFEIPTFVPVLGSLSCFGILSYAKAEELRIALMIAASITLLYFVMRPKTDAIKNMET